MRNPTGPSGTTSEWLEIRREIAQWIEDLEAAATSASQQPIAPAPAASQPGLRRVDDAIAALSLEVGYDDVLDWSDPDEETWPGIEPPPGQSRGRARR